MKKKKKMKEMNDSRTMKQESCWSEVLCQEKFVASPQVPYDLNFKLYIFFHSPLSLIKGLLFCGKQ